MSKIYTIIAAGGLGTRLSEYTQTIPKTMVKVLGIPILERIIKYYSKFNFKPGAENIFFADIDGDFDNDFFVTVLFGAYGTQYVNNFYHYKNNGSCNGLSLNG